MTEINDLEKVASEFIIGYKPLTKRQKKLIARREELELLLKENEIHKKRIINLLQIVEKEIVECQGR